MAEQKPPTSKTTASSNRRRLLKRVTAISGIAAVPYWKTPVVKSVVLPAHAQTSGYTCTIEVISGGVLRTRVMPPPPFPPGALIRCRIISTGDMGTVNTASATDRTNANGVVTFEEEDFGDDASTSNLFDFQTGEVLESFVFRKSCVNADECDASCEEDLTDELIDID